MPLIYALKNRTSDDVYYGSTKQTLNRRLSVHKSGHKKNSRYVSSFEILKCPTAYIELIEEVSEEQRYEREGWWIRNNPCVNKQVAGRSKTEYKKLHPTPYTPPTEHTRELAKERQRKHRSKSHYNNLRNNLRPVDTSVQGV